MLEKPMYKTYDNYAFCNDDIDFNDIESDSVTFFNDGMGLVTIELKNVTLNDDNFVEDDPETIIHVTLIASCNR